jgi:hypothetical protein
LFVDDPYVHTIQENERKFFNAEHKDAYLKKMKDDAEKEGFIYQPYPNHKIQKLDQWFGIWSLF